MFPNNEFEITLVTYAEYDYRRWFTLSVHWGDYLLYYATQWKGPIVVVYYYNASSLSEKERLTQRAASRPNLRLVPYECSSTVIPINTLKNIGISMVTTTHFIVADVNLLPSSRFLLIVSFEESLYAVLKSTPGYLWRDPYFIGVIPAFEWSHPDYKQAIANEQSTCWLP